MTGPCSAIPNAPGRVGRYRLEHVLGLGAMGVVYKARDPQTRRAVAVKRIRKYLLVGPDRDQVLKRFRVEAAAGQRLKHPNIVAVMDCGDQDGMHYIVMEYIRGKSLRDYLREGRQFTSFEALAILQQVLSALAHAHGLGVIHRDVTPGNIFLDTLGQVRLMDFGIARIDASCMTLTAMVVGTPAYMAPEQCIGVDVDHRADLFAAGAVFYHLLTGQRPFDAPTIMTTMHKLLKEAPVVPSKLNSKVPPVFDKLINRALAKNPKHRYQSAREFTDELKAVARRLHSGPSKLTGRLEDWREHWRKPRVLGSTFALALGLGVLSVYWSYDKGGTVTVTDEGRVYAASSTALTPVPNENRIEDPAKSARAEEIARLEATIRRLRENMNQGVN